MRRTASLSVTTEGLLSHPTGKPVRHRLRRHRPRIGQRRLTARIDQAVGLRIDDQHRRHTLQPPLNPVGRRDIHILIEPADIDRHHLEMRRRSRASGAIPSPLPANGSRGTNCRPDQSAHACAPSPPAPAPPQSLTSRRPHDRAAARAWAAPRSWRCRRAAPISARRRKRNGRGEQRQNENRAFIMGLPSIGPRQWTKSRHLASK